MDLHQDDAPNKPIISPAVEGILIEVFKDELNFPGQEWDLRTSASYAHEASRYEYELMQAIQERQAGYAHLLVAQAFDVASSPDPAQLRVALTLMGATVLQWIEALDAKYGGV